MPSDFSRRFHPGEHLAKPPQVWDAPGFEQPGVKPIFYEGAPYKGSPTRCFAFVGFPQNASAEHPVPAVVLIHGGGGTAFPTWVNIWNERGYAAIAMDTCGCVPTWSIRGTYHANWPGHDHGGPRGWGRYDETFLPPEEQWMYHATTAVLKATALIKSFPQVDADNVGIAGISWGGYLTLTASAAAPKGTYKFAIPVYASAGFSKLPTSIIFSATDATPERVAEWDRLWNPEPALADVTHPVLFLSDAEDIAFPLPTWEQTVRNVGGPVQRSLRIDYTHDHDTSFRSKTEFTFADAVVNNRPLPVWGDMKRQGATISCPFAFEGRHPWKASLCYTRARGLWADWEWNPRPAALVNGCLQADIPYGTTAAFFHVMDDFGAQWSSSIMFNIPVDNSYWPDWR